MFLWLAEILQEYDRVFSIFDYITMRSILSVLTSLVISLTVGPFLIRTLIRRQIGQSIRDDGPQSHLGKSGTPTMGGMLIVISIVVTTLLWGDLENKYVWFSVLCLLSYAMIAGMLFGFGITILWILKYKAETYDLYEMIPGFFVGLAVTWLVSRLTWKEELA